ncbi:MAG: hypothetical protein PUC19_03275 [Ligilactobacillus ruminis]|nr:hypothetical protein [Ligilactobacillus ruminis]
MQKNKGSAKMQSLVFKMLHKNSFWKSVKSAVVAIETVVAMMLQSVVKSGGIIAMITPITGIKIYR